MYWEGALNISIEIYSNTYKCSRVGNIVTKTEQIYRVLCKITFIAAIYRIF
jgi:hypothetical protein